MVAEADLLSIRAWPRVKWTRAGQVAALLDGMVDLEQLYDQPPAAAFAALREVDRMQAARFLAQCLPRMEALRWVAVCLNGMGPPSQPARMVAKKALQPLARRAVGYQPADRLRSRPDRRLGVRRRARRVSRCTCRAAASHQPRRNKAYSRRPGAFGQAVAGAVMMASFAERRGGVRRQAAGQYRSR